MSTPSTTHTKTKKKQMIMEFNNPFAVPTSAPAADSPLAVRHSKVNPINATKWHHIAQSSAFNIIADTFQVFSGHHPLLTPFDSDDGKQQVQLGITDFLWCGLPLVIETIGSVFGALAIYLLEEVRDKSIRAHETGMAANLKRGFSMLGGVVFGACFGVCTIAGWLLRVSLAAALTIMSLPLMPLVYGIAVLKAAEVTAEVTAEAIDQQSLGNRARRNDVPVVNRVDAVSKIAKAYREHKAKQPINLSRYLDAAATIPVIRDNAPNGQPQFRFTAPTAAAASSSVSSPTFYFVPLNQLQRQDQAIVFATMANEARKPDPADFFNFWCMVSDPESCNDDEQGQRDVRAFKESPVARTNMMSYNMQYLANKADAEIRGTPGCTAKQYIVLNSQGMFVGMLGISRDAATIAAARQLGRAADVPDDSIMFSKYVVTNCRRQGVASLMHAYLFKTLQGQPVRSVVKAGNIKNQQALAKAGFEPVGQEMPQAGVRAACKIYRPRGFR